MTREISREQFPIRERAGAARPLVSVTLASSESGVRHLTVKNFVLVDSEALPEIFIKVLEAKRLMHSGKCKTIQESAAAVGISRTAFYKYKDSVFEFYEGKGKKSVTIGLDLEDTPGLLSQVLNVIANRGANILTINQTIPVNRYAFVTLTMEVLVESAIVDDLGKIPGVSNLRILALNSNN
jgi:chorismate mutase